MTDTEWTLERIESLLDSRKLQVAAYGPDGETRWYTCRRNGKTKLWKRFPKRFRIPIKYRFRDHAVIDDVALAAGHVVFWFREEPDAET